MLMVLLQFITAGMVMVELMTVVMVPILVAMAKQSIAMQQIAMVMAMVMVMVTEQLKLHHHQQSNSREDRAYQTPNISHRIDLASNACFSYLALRLTRH